MEAVHTVEETAPILVIHPLGATSPSQYPLPSQPDRHLLIIFQNRQKLRLNRPTNGYSIDVALSLESLHYLSITCPPYSFLCCIGTFHYSYKGGCNNLLLVWNLFYNTWFHICKRSYELWENPLCCYIVRPITVRLFA